MSLLVWLPLNGNLNNQGLSNISVTNNGATVDNNGKIGKCYRFGNGSASSNGINLNDNFVSIGSECSISVWVNPAGNHYHYNGTIISSGDWNHICWSFGLSQDNSQVDLLSSGYNKYVNCPIPLNTWTHLVCTRKNRVTTLYKNGIQIATSSSLGDLASDASNTYIGRETYANGYFTFNGKLNDVRIYDHCLSPKEVKEISKGLVLHYPLKDKYIEDTTNLITSFDTSFESYSDGTFDKFTLQAGGTTKVVSNIDGHNKCLCYTPTSSGRCYFTLSTKANKTYTISTNYLCSTSDSVSLRLERNGGDYSWSGSATSYTTPNKWQKLVITVTNTSDTTFYVFNYAKANTALYIDNIQIEEKDHATPYTSSSRSEAIIYDCSGYGRNGTKSGAITCDSDTPRYTTSYHFSNSQAINYTENLTFLTTGSISFWAKFNTKGSSGWLPFTGQSGSYYVMATSGGTGNFYNGNITASGAIKYYEDSKVVSAPKNDGKWHHYAITGINMSAWTAFKINNYSSSWNSDVNYADVRVYNTVLPAEDIAELYHSAVIVDNTGKSYAYEYFETN